MKYLSNLNGQEFGGKVYDQGDELKVNDDNRAAADILADRGDSTKVEDGDPKVTSNGDSAKAPDPLDHDADGRKGGSEAGDKATARKK
ncbi:MAG TPA: hypothetical protein VE053_06740 [Allosphingosinicella sp.]|nr:hypothetical protein [Allosphingosinicella sp.]